MDPAGIEPATRNLTGSCSTTELRARVASAMKVYRNKQKSANLSKDASLFGLSVSPMAFGEQIPVK